ncbi:MAG TPA: glycosyltransferase family 4 protein [Vicinamibacterales bacterium]|nr:glycosyltransferase family 4 protein [Vicinamibacterales bacterium]
MIRTVLVCEAQVPLVSGGAELHVRGLVAELARRGYRAERVSVPFKSYPKAELLPSAAAWRLVDLSETNYEPIDLVIATKFPTYFVRHPNKVTWLFHQYRAIYELCGTSFSEFEHSEADVRLRDTLMRLDREALSESKRIFTNARNTAARLHKYNGLVGEPLYHPPPHAGVLRAGPFGDYVLSVGRLELNKRVDLIVRAMAYADRSIRLIVVGEGPQRPQLEALAAASGVADRITWTGRVDERQLVDLYAGALAVVFPPYDEDYGYITLEAFLAHKPVITTSDSGGPLEFVEDGGTGLVTSPDPEALGAAVSRLAGDRQLAVYLGRAGYERVRSISWDDVIDRLIGAADSNGGSR